MADAIPLPKLVHLQRALVSSRDCGEHLERRAREHLAAEIARLAGVVSAGAFQWAAGGRCGTDRAARWCEVIIEGDIYLVSGPYDGEDFRMGLAPAVDRVEHVRRARPSDVSPATPDASVSTSAPG